MPVGLPLSLVSSSGVSFQLETFSLADLVDIYDIEQSASVYPWSKSNIQSSILNDHLCVGARINERWVGHVILSEHYDELEVLILAVAPEYKGQGIAYAMLTGIFSSIPIEITRVILEVRESNTVAMSLYKKLGFTELGRRKRYYPTLEAGVREDALLFQLELKRPA